MKKNPIHKKRTNSAWKESQLIDDFREFLRTEFEKGYGDYANLTYQDLFDELDPIWKLYGGSRIGDDRENLAQEKYETYIRSKLNQIASNENSEKAAKKGKGNITRFLAWLSECQPELEQKWFGQVVEYYKNAGRENEIPPHFAENGKAKQVTAPEEEAQESKSEPTSGNENGKNRGIKEVFVRYWYTITGGIISGLLLLLLSNPNFIKLFGGNKETKPLEIVETPKVIPEETVTPVWDRITKEEWSTKVMRHFETYICGIDKQSLYAAAEKGNVNALTLAAIGHHRSFFSEHDFGLELREYLHPACDGGQGRACAMIGEHIRYGRGYPKDNYKAANFYEKSCDLGNSIGCHYLGVRYLFGEGKPIKKSRASEIFIRECDNGVGYSCWYMSGMYFYGIHLTKDEAKAREYYRKNCDLILPFSCEPSASFFEKLQTNIDNARHFGGL